MLLLYEFNVPLAYGIKKIQDHLEGLDSRRYLNNQVKFFTQVLRPCSLVMENMMHVSGLQTVVVTIEELSIKVRL